MEILENAVNKRILSCNLPTSILFPCTNYDFIQEHPIKNDFPTFLKYEDTLIFYIEYGKKLLAETKTLNTENIFESDINVLINTSISPKYLPIDLFNQYKKIIPVFSTIDKLLWISLNHLYSTLVLSNYSDEFILEFINLYKFIIRKEISTKKTVDINMDSSNKILNIILSDWNSENKAIKHLNKRELDSISNYLNIIEKTYKKQNSYYIQAKQFSDYTNSEWKTYIELINKRAKQEQTAINQLSKTNSISKKEKIIKNLKIQIKELYANDYIINNKKVDIWYILEKIEKRFSYAPMYCQVYTKDDKSFILHPKSKLLLLTWTTYNYLFITFHEFRLRPSIPLFKNLIGDSIQYLLNIMNTNQVSKISNKNEFELVNEYISIITSIYNDNKINLTSIPFKKIQDDISLFEQSINYRYNLSSPKKDYDKVIYSKRDINNQNIINKLLEVKSKEILLSEMEMLKKIEDQHEHISFTMFFASLQNINYIISESLRIFIDNFKDDSKQTLKNSRTLLLNIDSKITQLIYSDLNENEIGMLEYREKINLASSSLSYFEQKEEKLINDQFADILIESINRLEKDLNNKSIEELIETKTELRDLIFNFPSCRDKDNYISLFENFSKLISNALINQQKESNSNFENIKANIQTIIGPKYTMLPHECLDALATAELLYSNYANDNYNNKGFDYSSISALYYQSFEIAYNHLIWNGYANILNKTVINGIRLIDYFSKHKAKIDDVDYLGYLSPYKNDRTYYLEFKNKKIIRAKPTCMYANFHKLLKTVISNKTLDKFNDYISSIAGFKDRNEMICCNDFILLFTSLVQEVEESIEYRNNASHGGTKINIEQCYKDKTIILGDLSNIRDSNIGMLQALLKLINYKDI